MHANALSQENKIKKKSGGAYSKIRKNWQLYVLLALPLIYLLIFKYWPMYGLQIAFKDYNAAAGFTGSPFVGMKHFIRFFNSPQCWNIIKNTVLISSYTIVLSLPIPIALALCLTYCRSKGLGKTIQLVTYFPHFLSTVIIVSLLSLFFSTNGILNSFLNNLFGTNVSFMQNPKYFRSMYVWSGVWQQMGWNSILYFAALRSVNTELREAAVVDGANKLKIIWHVDLPSIIPTIVVTLIMNLGTIFKVGFDKTFLMQNVANLDVSEVLSTYEYKVGIGGQIPSYSYPAAIGFVASVVTFLLIIVTNKIAKRVTEVGLW